MPLARRPSFFTSRIVLSSRYADDISPISHRLLAANILSGFDPLTDAVPIHRALYADPAWKQYRFTEEKQYRSSVDNSAKSKVIHRVMHRDRVGPAAPLAW